MLDLLNLVKNKDWRVLIEQGVSANVIAGLGLFLEQELAHEKVFPAAENWFKAINESSIEQVKIVILGQDPYHGSGQAHGLSFSVPEGMKIPPSLRNIFKEIQTDIGINNTDGDLSAWSKQGVLLLNAVFTVREGSAGSHANKGWEQVSDEVIRICSRQSNPIVFMLWGGFAAKKRVLIDETKHLVLTAAHPSPLSAYRGWFGCRHFSQANDFLIAHGRAPINWQNGTANQLSLLDSEC